jgi:alkylation response protein AidB-like acyl-CoA dehydrogenase
MDFTLPDEMKMFGDSVRDWVNKEAPKDYAREVERHEDQYPFELWDKMTAACFHGVGIDEAYGGQGGDISPRFSSAAAWRARSPVSRGSGPSRPSPVPRPST